MHAQFKQSEGSMGFYTGTLEQTTQGGRHETVDCTAD